MGEPIPFCGFPYFVLDTYLPRLVSKGILVAVCEQEDDPKNPRALKRRSVKRL